MNASEAKAKADLYHTEKAARVKENSERALDFIIKKIDNAAKDGQYSLLLDIPLMKEACIYDNFANIFKLVISELEDVYLYKIVRSESLCNYTVRWDHL